MEILSYEEFKNTVPKETFAYFGELLTQLNYFSDNNLVVSGEPLRDSRWKRLFLSISLLDKVEKYKPLLSKFGFNIKKVIIQNIKASDDYEALYNKYSDLVPILDDSVDYYSLSPIDIVLDVLKKEGSIVSNDYINTSVLSTNFSTFRRNIESYRREETVEEDNELEKEIFINVPTSTICYLEMASRIRNCLRSNLSTNDQQLCRKLDDDIVPLSLLIALYSQDPSYQDEVNPIISLFKEHDVSLQKIKNSVKVSYEESTMKGRRVNVNALKNLYYPYLNIKETDEINLNNDDLSILSIVKRLLDRKFTNSLVIEKIISKIATNYDFIKDFDTEIAHFIEENKYVKIQEEITSFYLGLNRETKEFIKLTGKTYSYLLKKYNNPNDSIHSSKLITNDNDLVVLSLLISGELSNSQFSIYLKENGLYFDKIMELLNIKVSKEEILKEEIENELLVKKYKKFLSQGVNEGAHNIALRPDRIMDNICNSAITKSNLIENIFNAFNFPYNNLKDFYKVVIDFINEKNKKDNEQKKEAYYRDFSVDTIKILSTASGAYLKLKEDKRLDENMCVALSILISEFYYFDNNKDVKEFLEKLGLDQDKIKAYLKFSCSISYLQENMDVLYNKFNDYIYGYNNEGKSKTEITPIMLLSNLFNKKFHQNSVCMNKFLYEMGKSFEELDDFNKLYDEFLVDLRYQKLENEIRSIVNESSSVRYNVLESCYMYSYLKEHNKNNYTKEELLILAPILVVMDKDWTYKYILERNGITKDFLLNVLGLEKVPNEENMRMELEEFNILKKYYVDNYGDNCKIVEKILEDEKSKILLEKLGINFHHLKVEMDTKKPYEEGMSIDERVSILSSLTPSKLDGEVLDQTIVFGDELTKHSRFIHESLPNLIVGKRETGIDKIEAAINGIYVPVSKEELKEGVISRFFKPSQIGDVKYRVDRNKLFELTELINENIETLKQDLLSYNAIRKYIELYLQKTGEYIELSDAMLSELIETNQGDATEDNIVVKLNAYSQILILNDKKNRFTTTNLIMQKELCRVNEAIVNHFITINSLEMARDDLIPLIHSEIFLGTGRKNSESAMELAKSVMGLFQALLDKNADLTKESMSNLEKVTSSNEKVAELTIGVSSYLETLSLVDTNEKPKVLEMKPNNDNK